MAIAGCSSPSPHAHYTHGVSFRGAQVAVTAGLSVALFAPAWLYECERGKHSAEWMYFLESVFCGGTHGRPPYTPLLNHSGAAGDCGQWTVTASGGDGWATVAVTDGPFPTAFVTSHEWAEKFQIVACSVPSPGAVVQVTVQLPACQHVACPTVVHAVLHRWLSGFEVSAQTVRTRTS